MEKEGKPGFKLYDGRPVGEACVDMETKAYDFLDRLEIRYKTLKHPAAFTIDECKKIRDEIHAPVFKNLFLTNRQQTKFYLLVMLGEKPFKTKYLSAQIGSARLSFADEAHMQRFLGVTPGSVTPIGIMNDFGKDITVLLDEDLRRHDDFACHPCINTASVVLSLHDLTDRILPATGHTFTWVTLPTE